MLPRLPEIFRSLKASPGFTRIHQEDIAPRTAFQKHIALERKGLVNCLHFTFLWSILKSGFATPLLRRAWRLNGALRNEFFHEKTLSSGGMGPKEFVELLRKLQLAAVRVSQWYFYRLKKSQNRFNIISNILWKFKFLVIMFSVFCKNNENKNSTDTPGRQWRVWLFWLGAIEGHTIIIFSSNVRDLPGGTMGLILTASSLNYCCFARLRNHRDPFDSFLTMSSWFSDVGLLFLCRALVRLL